MLLDGLLGETGSDLLRKVTSTFATRAAIIGLGLLTTVLLARILGPEGLGLYAVASAVGAVGVQFGNLGLHASNTYYVARDRSLLPALVANAVVVGLMLGGAFTVLGLGAFSLLGDVAPLHGSLLFLALMWIPVGLSYLLLQHLLLGVQEVRAYNRIELSTKLIAFGLIAFLALLKVTSVQLVFGATLLALVIGVICALRRLCKEAVALRKPSLELLSGGIRYGLKAYLAAFFAFLVLKADLFMVKRMLGSEQAGYYALSATMADMALMLPAVIGTVLFPRLAAMPDDNEKWRLARNASLATGAIVAPVLLFAFLIAKPTVRVVFGEGFTVAIPAFQALLPGVLFLGVQTVAVQYLNSVGFPRAVVVIWALSLLVNVVLNLWAIPAYGIIGAALVSSLSYALVFVLVGVLVGKRVYG